MSTDHDRPEDWLRAGQAMERVLLPATREGLAGSFVTQPLEWTDLRRPLRDPMTGAGRWEGHRIAQDVRGVGHVPGP